MHSKQVLAAAVSGIVGAIATTGLAQNFVRDDVAFGLSQGNAQASVELIRGYPAGTKVNHDFNVAFMQSMSFDNTDGFRHAAFGNLLAGNVGIGGVGNPGAVHNIQTQGGSPGASEQFFLSSTAAPDPTRVNVVSVSPNNQRLLVTGATPSGAGTVGQLTLMNYSNGANPGSGSGATFSNVTQLADVVQGNQTTGHEWLDNNTFITITHPFGAGNFDGQLQRVSVGAGNVMTATPVGSPITFPVDGVNANTSFAYEPTLSPYVYMSVSQFSGGLPLNRLIVLDPANNFASVGSFDYSNTANTVREISFTGNGDLIMATAAGSIETIAGANVLANLANNNSTDYYLSALPGANFTGADTAATMVDYKTPGVTVDMRQRKAVVRYFPGTVNDPTVEIRTRLQTGRNGGSWDGTGSAILSSDAAAASPANKAIGYAQASDLGLIGQQFGGVTVTGPAILMRFTYYGDTDLNGIVNFDDYARIDGGFLGGGSTWFSGDFNYDAIVNFDDYALIDSAFLTQSGGLPRAIAFLDGSDPSMNGMDTEPLQKVAEHFSDFGAPYANSFLANVPEPASLAAIGVLGAALLGRRRRA